MQIAISFLYFIDWKLENNDIKIPVKIEKKILY